MGNAVETKPAALNGKGKRAAKLWRGIPLAVCLGLLALVLYKLYFLNLDFYLNMAEADSFSEILLAQELARQGRFVITTTWYYATEVRILHNQIVMAVLFRFIENPLVVQRLSTVIISFMMAGSGIFLFRSLKAKWWQSVLAGTLVVVPFSPVVFQTNLAFNYYSFPVLLAMLYAGMFLRFYGARGKRLHTPWLVGLCVFGFVLGLCGTRYLLIVFMPLVVATWWPLLRPFNRAVRRKKPQYFIAALREHTGKTALEALLLLAAHGVGQLVNATLMHRIFSFGQGAMLINGTGIVARMRSLVWDFLDLFCGVQTGSDELLHRMSTAVLWAFAVLMLLCIGILVWMLRREEEGALALYIRFVLANLFFAAVTSILLNNPYDAVVPRYLLLSVMPIVTAPVLLLLRKDIVPFTSRAAVLALCMCVTVAAPMVLRENLRKQPNINYPMQQTAQWLVENGYTYGFSTYWQSAPLRFFSGQEIDTVMVKWLGDRYELFLWSTTIDDTFVDYSYESVFFIMTKDEYATAEHYLSQFPMIYEYNSIIVLEVPVEAVIPAP